MINDPNVDLIEAVDLGVLSRHGFFGIPKGPQHV